MSRVNVRFDWTHFRRFTLIVFHGYSWLQYKIVLRFSLLPINQCSASFSVKLCINMTVHILGNPLNVLGSYASHLRTIWPQRRKMHRMSWRLSLRHHQNMAALQLPYHTRPLQWKRREIERRSCGLGVDGVRILVLSTVHFLFDTLFSAVDLSLLLQYLYKASSWTRMHR